MPDKPEYSTWPSTIVPRQALLPASFRELRASNADQGKGLADNGGDRD